MIISRPGTGTLVNYFDYFTWNYSQGVTHVIFQLLSTYFRCNSGMNYNQPWVLDGKSRLILLGSVINIELIIQFILLEWYLGYYNSILSHRTLHVTLSCKRSTFLFYYHHFITVTVILLTSSCGWLKAPWIYDSLHIRS